MRLIQIIYQDEALVVVNKPANLLVVPTDKGGEQTLTTLLTVQLNRPVYPCHRLDKETSGVMVYAKSPQVQTSVMNQFRDKTVRKTYIALTSGHLRVDEGEINLPIFNKKKRKNLQALTSYRVLTSAGKFSVVEVKPKTGRTNQIRIHFANIGFPLLGEQVFAKRKDSAVKFRRVALHSFFIEFNHPFTGKKVSFTAPLPNDMIGLFEEWKVKLNKSYFASSEKYQ